MKCKICQNNSEYYANAEILYKYKIQYFRCTHCGFIQTETPFWLDEAYSEAINYTDIGLLKRNYDSILPTANVIKSYYTPSSNFIDYGAGYGIFVRLMRDAGYNFFWQDKYCENLFAKEFEADDKSKYELLTAYEVFEHLDDVHGEINQMLNYSQNILFSTYLIPETSPKPDEWWYFATDHGQHISLYSRESLRILAKQFDKKFYTNGKNIHLFTNKKINNFYFKLLTFPYSSAIMGIGSKKNSLLNSDYNYAMKKLRDKDIK